MTRKRQILYVLLAIFGLTAALISLAARMLMRPTNATDTDMHLYIDADDTADSVCVKVSADWTLQQMLRHKSYRVRTGHYVIMPGEAVKATFRRLRNGEQTPIKLTIPNVRTMNRLAGALGQHLMLDSATIADKLADSTFCETYGYTLETIPSLFIPNTYECYWDMTLQTLMKRMEREHRAFWNEGRQQKAAALGLSEVEVATLASIVDSETANNGEKPTIAGLYLNRLKKHIPLQADPTVIFAIGDFSIRRVLNVHLKVDSPYNTYLHTGLPPGPIRVPSIAGIDAVLNHVQHNYLYMCAKEDFSGTHNFAATYSEHLANARRYTRALNMRNIK